MPVTIAVCALSLVARLPENSKRCTFVFWIGHSGINNTAPTCYFELGAFFIILKNAIRHFSCENVEDCEPQRSIHAVWP